MPSQSSDDSFFRLKNLGPIAPYIFVTGALLALFRNAPSSLSPIAIVVVAFVLYFAAFLAHGAMSGGKFFRRTHVGLVAAVLVYVLTAVFVVLLVGVVSGMLIGVPIDLRYMLAPENVYRNPKVPAAIPLSAHYASDFLLPEYWNVGDGLDAKIREENGLFLKWIRDGGDVEGIVLVAYTSEIFKDYFKEFDATLRFTSGESPVLYSGIAFVRQGDSYRQIDFVVSDDNQDGGSDPQENLFRDVRVDAGDQLFVVVQVGGVEGSSISQFDAELLTAGDLLMARRSFIGEKYK